MQTVSITVTPKDFSLSLLKTAHSLLLSITAPEGFQRSLLYDEVCCVALCGRSLFSPLSSLSTLFSLSLLSYICLSHFSLLSSLCSLSSLSSLFSLLSSLSSPLSLSLSLSQDSIQFSSNIATLLSPLSLHHSSYLLNLV